METTTPAAIAIITMMMEKLVAPINAAYASVLLKILDVELL
jgi:hypothetical protein